MLVNTDSLKNQMDRQQQVKSGLLVIQLKSGQFFDPANPIQQCGSVNIHQLGSMEQCPFVGQIAAKSLSQHTGMCLIISTKNLQFRTTQKTYRKCLHCSQKERHSSKPQYDFPVQRRRTVGIFHSAVCSGTAWHGCRSLLHLQEIQTRECRYVPAMLQMVSPLRSGPDAFDLMIIDFNMWELYLYRRNRNKKSRIFDLDKIFFTFFFELDIKKMNRFCISIEKEVESV